MSIGRKEESNISGFAEISDSLNKVGAVRSCFMVEGRYQIIAEIESNGIGRIGQIVTDEIRVIPGVEKCSLCLVISDLKAQTN